MTKLQEKPSTLKREHPSIQKKKIITFFYVCGTFLPSWILDTDPGNPLNPDPILIRIGIRIHSTAEKLETT
jgi:hypothetical protein